MISKVSDGFPRKKPSRIVIERVTPQADCGRFPVRRIAGEDILVGADIHADGHDVLAAVVLCRREGEKKWKETPMSPADPGNDYWEGRFSVDLPGAYEYTVEAWVDAFGSWRDWVERKFKAGEDVLSELPEGAKLLHHAILKASPEDAEFLRKKIELLAKSENLSSRFEAALDPELREVMSRHPDRSRSGIYEPLLRLRAERLRARFGTWYEMFPRSAGTDPSRGASFKEAERRLPDIAAMGFDVLYLAPIHPISKSFRRGKNNSPQARPGEPGSPWAIGSSEGGHTAVHPGLGTLEDFDRFLAEAARHGLEIALDIALQCSPEHPYVREHPGWFRHRSDGTIRYAENPPKKYYDIYPLEFECEDWKGLWKEMREIFLFWAARGVRIFRVDNPHTKPYHFWQWLIAEIKEAYPDAIFLSEAFTRPKVMKHLAKLGFTQSYTYFTWRNEKRELADYLTELTRSGMEEYFQPNFFTNTPDILPPVLQKGGRPAFKMRLVLAATLSPSYGIYNGFELCENQAVPGTEEYLDSEKYEIKVRDWNGPGNIKDLVSKVNSARRENPALRELKNLEFLPCDNENILFYAKATGDKSNVLLIAVNLDPFRVQEGGVSVPLDKIGLPPGSRFKVRDLLTDSVYVWSDKNFVRLDPQREPAHILRVEGKEG